MQFYSGKAQSAIEYLMTYGWMLLVVAVVGSAVFAVTQNRSIDSINGFSGSDVLVDDFGVTSDDHLALDVRSGSGQSVIVSRVNVTDPNTGNSVVKTFTSDNRVEIGDNRIFELPGVFRSDSGGSLNVDILYNSGVLSNLSTSGTINGYFGVDQDITVTGPPEEGSVPAALNQLEVSVQ